MKLAIYFFLTITFSITAQDMNIEKLGKIILNNSDSLQVNGNSWKFIYKNKILICIADKKANRMRIISPIAKKQQLTEELILNSLIANFHTALDVKYAISDEILWSVFTHPLKELSAHQVEDAISQVYYANLTFGSIYSSTSLTFPGNIRKEEIKKKTPLTEKI